MENWKKKIILFLSSQAISLFGSSLVQYAIIWYITLKTGSGMMMTLSTLCALLPQVIISLFAGVWADKYSKKWLIMAADTMIAISTLVVIIFFFLEFDSVWLLFAILIFRSLGSGIQTPTVTSFIPEIVPEQHLMKVNGINTTIQSIMLILSPAMAGALLSNVELKYIFFIDVITALIGVGIFSFIKVVKKKKTKAVKGEYLASMKEGIVYTKNHSLISRMLVYLGVFNLFIAPIAVLTPLLVTRTFGADPWYLTFNEIVFFVGNIIGGILISVWGGFKNRIHTIGLGCVICGVFSILIGVPFHFIFYLICMGLLGVAMPFCNTPFITLFQENVDSDKQGRVFSLITIISGSLVPLAMIFYGPLADYVKIEYLMMITGLLFLIATVFLLKDKVFKKTFEKEVEPVVLTDIEAE